MLQLKPGSKGWWGTAAAGVVLTIVCSLYLMLTNTLNVPPRLLALGLGVAGLATATHLIWPMFAQWLDGRFGTLPEYLLRAAPYAAVVVTVFWAFWPAPFELPINQDHGHHFFATKLFVEDLLGTGHLFGWTDRVAGGLPFGDVYATPAYFLTSALHVLSFGLVSLEASYSWGVFSAWLLAGFVVIGLTREVLPGHTLAPTVAGVAMLLDPGGDREGGWIYSLFHAVWPQFMATACMALGVLLVLKFVRKPSWRAFALAALTFGLSIWVHPMIALNLVWLTPTVFILVLFDAWRNQEGSPNRAVPWLVPMFASAAIIGFGFFARMWQASDQIKPYAAHGDTLWELGHSLLSGSVFANQLALTTMLGLLGIAGVLVRRELAGLVVVGLTALFVLLGSMELVLGHDLGLSEWLPMLMYRRFFISAKPFWFVLVGVGAGVAWTGLVAVYKTRRAAMHPSAMVVATPLLWAVLVGHSVLVPAPVGGVLGYKSSGVGESLDALATLIDNERSALNVKRIVVADWHDNGDDSHYRLFAYAKADAYYLATKAPPCQALKTVMVSRDIKGLKWLGATHLVSTSKKSFEGAKYIGQAGKFHLYRLMKEVPQTPVKLKGAGRATVLTWTAERREIDVIDTGDNTSLIVGQPPYSKWTATQNGEPLTIDRTRHGGANVIQMGKVTDGKVVLTYQDSFLEHFSFAASLLAIAILLALILLAGPRPAFLDRIPKLALVPQFGPRLRFVLLSVATLACVAFSLLSVLMLTVLGKVAQDDYWTQNEPEGTQVLSVLHHNKPLKFEYSPDPYCLRAFSRNPRVTCDASELLPRLEPARPRGEKIAACMHFGVPDKGNAQITFDLPTGTTHLKGFLTKGSSGLKVTALLGEKVHPLKDGAIKLPTQDLAIVRLQAKNPGGSSSICLELVALKSTEGEADRPEEKSAPSE